jgi:hypothetical protein
MKSIHTGSAVTPPVSFLPNIFFSSKPIHTPQVMEGEKPTNQASVKSLVVPVFPANGCFRDLARVAVPDCTTPCNSMVMMRAVRALTTSRTSGKFSSSTRPS